LLTYFVNGELGRLVIGDIRLLILMLMSIQFKYHAFKKVIYSKLLTKYS